ncbi:MAG: hypothetical protein A2790_20240 [Phenylobacterium sp. RIFCSPHIGHO2_01_FULL_69_31]|uniref:hypothetical protein n=1 Tax=Phenylobacterium sp. RIFCSPHIGHO2_01_FULL_69_31 TaxID=1801944 RepID=UPI0008AEB264|nr:hypothetical protein [Phenylobacterium sp. RIFCSPHIGHO2_01_FULL_69_31]OHB26295.1 MAG: hypothetical protein A2790_20240 [Phenylobacterium sp. RIFCSPHIGHO2_01_FULL_69_31]
MATPDLDARATENFTYGDLCHCSETWRRTRVANTPREPDTYAAIRQLCAEILEPAYAAFGSLELTYGFAGPALTRLIHRRIAPRLDQHAGYERNRTGALICPRGGQAADFRVPGVPASRVALHLAETTPFDRIYFYGDDRPLHVSIGPQNARQIVELRVRNQRLVPRPLALVTLGQMVG